MKRSFSFERVRGPALVAAGTGLVAATYGLVRLAYGLFLPDVQADLGLSTSTAGLVSSGGSVAYCVGALVGFVAAGRHPRRLVVLAAATAGGGAMGMAAAPDVPTFAVAAVVSSTGAGLASPALVRIVARSVPRERVDRSQTVVNAGTGPGLVAAGALALVLLPQWRVAWAAVGVVTLLVALAVVLLDDGGAPRRAEVEARAGRPPRSWFADHAPLVVAATAMGTGSAAVWSFGRTHLVEAGQSVTVSVVAWIAIGLGGAAVLVTAGALARLGPPRAWTVTTLVVAGSIGLLGLRPDDPPAALAACAAFGWGYTAGTGVLIAWTSRLDPGRAPEGTSMLFVVLVLGQALGSAVSGVLLGTLGSGPTFLVAAALSAVGALVPRWWRAGAGGQSRWYTSGMPSASSSRVSRSWTRR